MGRNGVLTDKQKLFVEEYLQDYNATQAAIRAGFSLRSAEDYGKQLLRKTPVRDAIARREAELLRGLDISARKVAAETARLAFSNLGDLVDLDTGELLPNVRKADLRAVQSLRVKKVTRRIFDNQGNVTGEEETVTRDIKLWDKTKPLDMLARMNGMYYADKRIGDESEADGGGVIEIPAREVVVYDGQPGEGVETAGTAGGLYGEG